jgi:hypothetical protein
MITNTYYECKTTNHINVHDSSSTAAPTEDFSEPSTSGGTTSAGVKKWL